MTSPSAYLDSSGHPQLRTSIVGFLDLLGFSQTVTSATEAESQVILGKICSAIHDSRSYVRQVLGDEVARHLANWSVKFFSDNLVVGYAHEDSPSLAAAACWFTVRCVQRYQLRMVINGLFLRGGLTSGPLCLTDEIIFGKGLIESYHLEEKAAIVPRVVLSETLSRIAVEAAQAERYEKESDVQNAICRDVDGWWFVNYLQAAEYDGRVDWSLVEQHKHQVLACLSSTNRHDVLPKYGWVCRYHNMYCHWHRSDPAYSDRYHIPRDDEHSVIYRLGEIEQPKTKKPLSD